MQQPRDGATECICTASRRKLAGPENCGSNKLSIAKDFTLPSWEASSVLVWPPHRPIDPALYTAVVVDQHRYSGDWWKVQQEEARGLGEEKAREAAEPEAK
jgi:hypothetical protein